MDDPILVTALIERVRSTTVAYLERNANRLTRYSHLLGRFSEAVAAWEDRRAPNARQITETVNELLIARWFLQNALCRRLEYETPLAATGKTIDFLFHTTDGNRIFYDVKTVLPDDQDASERYEKAKTKGWFTPCTELVLEGELSGSLAHYYFASREKFLCHTLELEEKIRGVSDGQDRHSYFRMAACRGLANLSVLYSTFDPARAIETCAAGLETAKKIGDLGFQSRLYANLAVAYCALTNRCDVSL